MSYEPSLDDITAAREQGDLKALLLLGAGRAPSAPRQRERGKPGTEHYHIARPGAWPCGTAASGPTPGPSCPDCKGEGVNS